MLFPHSGRSLRELLASAVLVDAARDGDGGEILFRLDSSGLPLGLACSTGSVDVMMPEYRLQTGNGGGMTILGDLSRKIFLQAGGTEYCLLRAEETGLDEDGLRPWLEATAAYFPDGPTYGVVRGTIQGYRWTLRRVGLEIGARLFPIAFSSTPLSRSYVGEPHGCDCDKETARRAAQAVLDRFLPCGWIVQPDEFLNIVPMDANDFPSAGNDELSSHERLEIETAAREILDSIHA